MPTSKSYATLFDRDGPGLQGILMPVWHFYMKLVKRDGTTMGRHSARCTAVRCGRKNKSEKLDYFLFFLETMMCLVSISIGTLMTYLPT